MSALKMTAIVMIVAGIWGLSYGSFSYTKETEEVKLGPIELSVKEKKTVNVPIWAGAGLVAIGSGLLIVGNKKS